jgi:hypothetical protein
MTKHRFHEAEDALIKRKTEVSAQIKELMEKYDAAGVPFCELPCDIQSKLVEMESQITGLSQLIEYIDFTLSFEE